jgi:hypothetical protein
VTHDPGATYRAYSPPSRPGAVAAILWSMDDHPSCHPPDPLALLSRLTAAAVRTRLDALEAERRALLPLLRSLLARERFTHLRRGARRE